MYQKTVLVGNLGKDPELRYTAQGGDAVCSFPVAVNRKWTGQDGNTQEETTWFRVSVWGSQAESCNQYLSKGRQVLVEGRLIPDKETGGPRIWSGNDGLARASFELRAVSVQFLGGGSSDNGQAASSAEPALAEDDIPY